LGGVVVMLEKTLKTKKTSNVQFVPKMENFETSLMYEGLSVKKENKQKSIAELRQKYAR
jgi:hypothetical protein